MKRIREHIVKDSDLLVTKLEDGQFEIRWVVTDENGDFIYYRYVIEPGQAFENEDRRIQRVVKLAHTSKVISDFQIAKAISKLKLMMQSG